MNIKDLQPGSYKVVTPGKGAPLNIKDLAPGSYTVQSPQASAPSQPSPITGYALGGVTGLANNPISNAVVGFGKSIIKDVGQQFLRPAVTATNLAASGTDLIGAGIGKLVGNKKFESQAVQQSQSEIGKTRTVPFFGEVKPLPTLSLDLTKPKEVFSTQNLKAFADIAGNATQIATNLFGLGEGEAATKKVVEKGLKTTLREAAPTILKTATKEGGLFGGLQGLGSGLSQKDATLGSIALDTVAGLGLGTAFGLGLGAVGIGMEGYDRLKNPQTFTDALKSMFPTSRTQFAQLQRFDKDPYSVLTEMTAKSGDSGIANNGINWDTRGAVSKIEEQATQENKKFGDALKASNTYVSLDQWEQDALKQARKEFSGTARTTAENKIKQEASAYKSQFWKGLTNDKGEAIIPTFDFNENIKKDAWSKAKSAFNSTNEEKLAANVFAKMGDAGKNIIEKTVPDASIKAMNQRLGDLQNAIDFWNNKNGTRVGRTNRAIAKIVGGIMGIGGGPLKSFVYALGGDKLAAILLNPELELQARERLVKGMQAEGRYDVVKEAERYIQQQVDEQSKRLALPSPKGPIINEGKPILLNAPTSFEKGVPQTVKPPEPLALPPGPTSIVTPYTPPTMQQSATKLGLPTQWTEEELQNAKDSLEMIQRMNDLPKSLKGTQDIQVKKPSIVDLRSKPKGSVDLFKKTVKI